MKKPPGVVSPAAFAREGLQIGSALNASNRTQPACGINRKAETW